MRKVGRFTNVIVVMILVLVFASNSKAEMSTSGVTPPGTVPSELTGDGSTNTPSSTPSGSLVESDGPLASGGGTAGGGHEFGSYSGGAIIGNSGGVSVGNSGGVAGGNSGGISGANSGGAIAGDYGGGIPPNMDPLSSDFQMGTSKYNESAKSFNCHSEWIDVDELYRYGLTRPHCTNEEKIEVNCLTKIPLKEGELQTGFLHSTSFDSNGTAYLDWMDCESVMVPAWLTDPQGFTQSAPILTAIVIFAVGLAYFLRSFFSSAGITKVIDDGDIMRLERSKNLNLGWLRILLSSSVGFQKDSDFLMRRSKILNGSALLLIAVALCAMVTLSIHVASLNITNFGAAFAVTAPITILFVAAGYLLRISLGISSELASLRTEKSKSEVLLARSLAKVVSELDLDRVFEGHAKKSDVTEESLDGKPTEDTEKAELDWKTIARLAAIFGKGH